MSPAVCPQACPPASQHHRIQPTIPFLLGFVALLVQVTLIRQLLSLFSGNELDIGITLALWLLGFGGGSFLGSRLSGTRTPLAVSLATSSILVPLVVAFIRQARPLLGIQAGGVLPLPTTFWISVLATVPVSLVLGLQFPLVVRLLGNDSRSASRSYLLEALGSFAAGLAFAFILSTRVDGTTLTTGLSVILAILAALALPSIWLAALAMLPLAFHLAFSESLLSLRWPGFETIKIAESRYGELALLKRGEQLNLFRSGQFVLSMPDPEAEETRVHTAMTLHPAPREVLLVSNSPGLLREVLKYEDVKATLVADDPILVPFLHAHLPPEDRQALASTVAKVVSKDARRFIATGPPELYDLVIVDIPPPVTAASNRFFSTEFFREVRRVLKPEGVVVLHAIGAPGYLGPSARKVNGAILLSLRAAFTHVIVGSTESGLLAASAAPIESRPGTLRLRFLDRGIPVTVFQPYVFEDLLQTHSLAGDSGSTIETVIENTDDRPVALHYNLLHWAELQGSAVLRFMLQLDLRTIAITVLVFTLLSALLVHRQTVRVVDFSTATTGLTGMGFSVVLLLAFQSAYGHVYEALAFLTASFMMGAALGAALLGTPPRHSTGTSDLSLLIGLDAGFGMLLLASPVFLSGLGFYGLSMAAGLLAGGHFSTAVRAVRTDLKGPARLYGLDLAGASLGAILTALIWIPIAGIHATLLLLVGVKTISMIALLAVRIQHRNKHGEAG